MNEQEFLKVLIEAVPTIKSEEEIRKGFTYLSQHEDDMNLLTEAINTFKVTKDEESRNAIKTIWSKATGSAVSAKFGAKLNYIQALKNRCPEGTQLYKVGGRVECKKCGGNTKVKPTGKKRFSKGGEVADDSELTDNQRTAGVRTADFETRVNPILIPPLSVSKRVPTKWDYSEYETNDPKNGIIIAQHYLPYYGTDESTNAFDPYNVWRTIHIDSSGKRDTLYYTNVSDQKLGKQKFESVERAYNQKQNKKK